MKKSIKLALRASELRSEINRLEPVETNAETRRGKLAELETVETEFRTALTAEEAEERSTPAADGLTPEERELAAVTSRASLGSIFDAVLDHRAVEGPERELQQSLGLSANQIPLALLETRAAGVTPAPANVGQQQAPIIPAVFPMACATWLGVDQPVVGVGQAIFPVLSTSADAGVPAEGIEQAETAGAFTAELLSPGRIQASFRYSREDRARFLGMDMALRENLSMALSDELDAQILAGTQGLFTAQNLDNHNVAAVTTYALYRSGLAYGRVDGTYAGTVKDLKILMGAPTYAHAAAQFRSANAGDRAALEDLQDATAGVKVSAHVPAVNNDKQNAIIRLGMRRDAVCPIWNGVTLIPDEITKAAFGEIVLTSVMLYAFRIIRADGFYKIQTQHA